MDMKEIQTLQDLHSDTFDCGFGEFILLQPRGKISEFAILHQNISMILSRRCIEYFDQTIMFDFRRYLQFLFASFVRQTQDFQGFLFSFGLNQKDLAVSSSSNSLLHLPNLLVDLDFFTFWITRVRPLALTRGGRSAPWF